MNLVKWNEKFFEESGLLIWIYSNGNLICSNNKLKNRLNLNSFRKYKSTTILKKKEIKK